MNKMQLLEKTLNNKRGYKYHTYRTDWDIDTFDNEYYSLYHYGTLILKVRISEDGTKEIMEYGGYSFSDAESIRMALDMWCGELLAYFASGELWLDGTPMRKDMTPNVDIEAFKQSIQQLLATYNVKLLDTNRISVDGRDKIVFVNPYMQIHILDFVGGLDRFNGKNTKDIPKDAMLIEFIIPDTGQHGTRLIFKSQNGRYECYSVIGKYHNTVKKALKFITRDADTVSISYPKVNKQVSPYIKHKVITCLKNPNRIINVIIDLIEKKCLDTSESIEKLIEKNLIEKQKNIIIKTSKKQEDNVGKELENIEKKNMKRFKNIENDIEKHTKIKSKNITKYIGSPTQKDVKTVNINLNLKFTNTTLTIPLNVRVVVKQNLLSSQLTISTVEITKLKEIDGVYMGGLNEMDFQRDFKYYVETATGEKIFMGSVRINGFRHGDICFRKIKKIPTHINHGYRDRWATEQDIEYTRAVGITKVFNIQPNEHIHRVSSDKEFGIMELNGQRYFESPHGDLWVTHVEHEDLILPKGSYRQYLVHGLDRGFRRGGD